MNSKQYIDKILSESFIDNNILSIAKAFRNNVIKDHGDLKAMCYEISLGLSHELKKHEIDSKVIKGYFYIDNPDESQYDDEIDESEMRLAPHFWVEVNNKILDITADQFQDEVEGERIDEITYGNYNDFDRYINSKEN